MEGGRRRPYLSTDQDHFQRVTTRPLRKHLRQVSKTFDQWYLRRCANVIITVLHVRKGHFMFLKAVADSHICRRTETIFGLWQLDHQENTSAKFRKTSDKRFHTRWANKKNKIWQTAAIFQEHFRHVTTWLIGEYLSKFSKQSYKWSWRGCPNKKMLTDGQTDGQKDAGLIPFRKALPGQSPETTSRRANNIG